MHAQWAAVTLVAVLLALPVSGTGLSLTDQYLHPRALATIVSRSTDKAPIWKVNTEMEYHEQK